MLHETVTSHGPLTSLDSLPGGREPWAKAGFAAHSAYPMKVTPYYARLIRDCAASDPIALQAVPSVAEDEASGSTDPLGETTRSPLPGLLHVYPDRILLMVTNQCAVNCRHCNRRWQRMARPSVPLRDLLDGWSDYLPAHPEAREALISGGDPLVLDDGDLDAVLDRLRGLPRIGVIRIGSRVPVVLPARVTPSLTGMLRRHHPLFLQTQFNSFQECTEPAAEALNRLAEAGIPLSNQMVLLRGVNDSLSEIARVNSWLVRQRCRPYYLFAPEAVRGTARFRVPLADAARIAEQLRASSSGLACPTVVVDTPDGGGKVPLFRAQLATLPDGRTAILDLKGRWVSLE
jgi:lysine 2,3-aminomutase